MVSNIMQGFQGILLVFMLIGLLMGIWRGFNKSLIRIFVVMAMSIICFFITRPISAALVNTNITKLNIKIEGTEVATVKEAIVTLLEKVGFINELMTASPTFSAFVEVLPVLILNMVVFMACFLVLTLFSILISWLLSKWILHKIPKKERNRHRLLGGLVGAIQGVFVFAVMAIPVIGVINTVDKSLSAISKSSTTQTATYEATEQESEFVVVDETVQEESKPLVDTDQYNKYVSDFNKLPFMKVFKALGIKKLEVGVYRHLTTATVNKDKVCLENEVVTLSKATANIESLAKLSGSSSAQDFQNARDMINNLFHSKLFSHITEEVVNYAATEWSDTSDPKVFGMKKPDLGDIGNPLLDGALEELKGVTRFTLKNDLLKTVDLMETASNNGLLSALTGNGNSEEILRKFADNDGQAIADFIDVMVQSDTLCAILPDAVQTGLNSMYPTLGVPKDNAEKENKVLGDIQQIADTSSNIATDLESYVNKYHFDVGITEESTTQSEIAQIANALSAGMSKEQIKQVLLENTLTKTNSSEPDQVSLVNMDLWRDLKTREDLKINNQITKEDWQKEKITFASVFANIILSYDSVKNAESGKEFDSMDFDALGRVFDSMRHSILLDDKTTIVADRTSFNIVRAILQSDLMNGIDVTSSFMETIQDNWDNEEFKFEDAFSTLGSTIKVLNQFNNNQNLDANDVENLINGLKGESGELVKDILKDSILQNTADENLHKGITDMVDSLAKQDTEGMTEEDWQKEANALQSTLDILNKNNGGESLNSIEADDANQLVDNLLDSSVIYGALLDAANKEQDAIDLVQNEKGSALEQAIKDKFDSAEEGSSQQEKLDELYKLFFGSSLMD